MSLFKNSIDHVALFGVPRTGTSWLGQIFNSSPEVMYRFQPLFSYEFKDALSSNSTSVDIEKFYGGLLHANSEFVLQNRNISGSDTFNFVKSDPKVLLWKEVRYINIIENLASKSDTKFILIVRHPAATINSWIKAPKEFNNSWSQDEWRFAKLKNQGKKEEYNGFEKWKESTELFLDMQNKYPDRVRIVKYEELNDDPLAVTESLFSFVGITTNSQTEEFIAQSTSAQFTSDSYSVYRNKNIVDAWKKELSPKIVNEISSDLAHFEPAKILGYS